MSILKIINNVFPTRYNKLTKLIKALDTEKILNIAEYNHTAIFKENGHDVEQSCIYSGSIDVNRRIVKLETIHVYPLAIIHICDKYKLNIYDFAEWMVDKIYTNVSHNVEPTYNVNVSVINKLRMGVK